MNAHFLKVFQPRKINYRPLVFTNHYFSNLCQPMLKAILILQKFYQISTLDSNMIYMTSMSSPHCTKYK